MQEVKIWINRDNLPSHTDKEFEEWVEYELGYTGRISLTNPMSDRDLEVDRVQVE